MPFIAPLIGGALAAAGLTFFATAAGQAVISVGLSLGASYLAKRLAPKPSNSSQGTSLTLRVETNESREIAFGRVASAGSLKYHNTYGPNNNDYVQLVYVLADHECDGLEKVIVDGKEVTFDANGAALPPGVGEGGARLGKPSADDINYAGNLWIQFHNGAWSQDADAELVAQSNQAGDPPLEWTANERGRGVCYVRVTLKFDQDKFKTGLPPFLFLLRGAKLYDWRKDSTNGGSGAHRWGTESTYEWTDNPAVCLYNYRRGIFVNGGRLGGMSTPATSLPVAKWTAAANACEEDVTLLAGGTEDRYRLNGIVPVQSEHAGVVRDMLATMAGVEIDSGGVFVPIAGVAQSSIATIADTDLIAGEQAEIIPKLSRSVLINALFGTFRDPTQFYSETALPPRISLADEATDGAQLADNYSLGMVTSGTQGQRVLEVLRRKGRYQRRVTCRLRSRFAVLESGDWVTWTSDRYGWTSMQFEVLQATLNRDLTVDVELRETSTSIYAWTPAVDELSVTEPHPVGAGGSTLTTVSDVALTPVLIVATGGIERPGLHIEWEPIDDLTVLDLELQYRKVGDSIALEKTILDPSAGQYTWVDGIQGGVTYEARLRPTTAPERAVAWTAWIAMVDTTDPQVVDVALIAEAVPPDTITAAMLAAQERFELQLVTGTSALLGQPTTIGGLYLYGLGGDSIATRTAALAAQAERAAEAAIAGHLEHAGNRALIKTEETRRITQDEALVSLITTIQADLDTAEAAIVTEQTARATADTALATSISTETAARTSADSALSASVSAEETSRIAGDASLATSISTETANRISGDAANAASISSEATARASADTSLATLIDSLEAAVDTADAALQANIDAEATTRASADTATASTITSLTATVNTKTKTYLQAAEPSSGMTTGDLWFDSDDNNKAYRYSGSAWVATDDARIAANAASISSEATARASADTALSASITSLSTTVDGHTTSISTIQSSVNGIAAQWGVSIDVDGNAVGLIRLDGGANDTTFTVVANTFKVAHPGVSGGAAVPVFIVANVDGVAKLALRGDMLIDGSVVARHLDVATLSAIAADIGTCTAGVIRSSDSNFVVDLNNKTLTITA